MVEVLGPQLQTHAGFLNPNVCRPMNPWCSGVTAVADFETS